MVQASRPFENQSGPKHSKTGHHFVRFLDESGFGVSGFPMVTVFKKIKRSSSYYYTLQIRYTNTAQCVIGQSYAKFHEFNKIVMRKSLGCSCHMHNHFPEMTNKLTNFFTGTVLPISMQIDMSAENFNIPAGTVRFFAIGI